MRAVELFKLGHPHAEIARKLGIHPESMRRWKRDRAVGLTLAQVSGEANSVASERGVRAVPAVRTTPDEDLLRRGVVKRVGLWLSACLACGYPPFTVFQIHAALRSRFSPRAPQGGFVLPRFSPAAALAGERGDGFSGRLRVLHVHSRPTPEGIADHEGRLDAAGFRALATDPGTGLADVDDAYFCGPEGMTSDVRSVLTEQGLDSSRIHSERFTSTTHPTIPARKASAAPSTATPATSNQPKRKSASPWPAAPEPPVPASPWTSTRAEACWRSWWSDGLAVLENCGQPQPGHGACRQVAIAS
ncbi:hypothetical protein [Streptomyces chattanoogensis]|uniref:hypothetical protein n=1 Tax=Streptomyces chattanoogensis TaxID=66876 RepID=UPI003CCBF156